MYNRKDYVSDKDWSRFLEFSKDIPTPNICINLNTIKNNFEKLKSSFPYTKIFYAIKANPGEPVLKMLSEMGSNFDIASRYELDMIEKFVSDPERLSYGNTIKKACDIKYFYDHGVRMFATDSKDDLKNIAEYAPGSKVYVRILVENSDTADWPLSRKFGCHPDMAYDILVLAKELGLVPYGVSFHVGSQQRDIGAWNDAIAKVKYLFNSLEEEEGIELKMIDMGGGFPASYTDPTKVDDPPKIAGRYTYKGKIPLSKECQSYKDDYVEDQATDLDRFVKENIEFIKDENVFTKVKDLYARYCEINDIELNEKGQPVDKDAWTQNKLTHFLKSDYTEIHIKQKRFGGAPEQIIINMRLKENPNLQKKEQQPPLPEQPAPVKQEKKVVPVQPEIIPPPPTDNPFDYDGSEDENDFDIF